MDVRADVGEILPEVSGSIPVQVVHPLCVSRWSADPSLHPEMRRKPSSLPGLQIGIVDDTVWGAKVNPRRSTDSSRFAHEKHLVHGITVDWSPAGVGERVESVPRERWQLGHEHALFTLSMRMILEHVQLQRCRLRWWMPRRSAIDGVIVAPRASALRT